MIDDKDMMIYEVQFNEPDDTSCAAGFHQSNSPFMTMSKGDLINGVTLNENNETLMMEIVNVTHIISQTNNGQMTHKIVYDTKVFEV